MKESSNRVRPHRCAGTCGQRAAGIALLHDVLHHIENPAAYIKSLAAPAS